MTRTFRVTLDDKSYAVDLTETNATVDGESFDVRVAGEPPRLTVRVDGRPLTVEILNEVDAQLTVRVGDRELTVDLAGRGAAAQVVRPPPPSHVGDVSGAILAPMAGRILRVTVKAGDTVEAGDLLVVLEAMKMENEIRSPRSGVVRDIGVTEAQRVAGGTTLVTIG